jgi:hypothetical protein
MSVPGEKRMDDYKNKLVCYKGRILGLGKKEIKH